MDGLIRGGLIPPNFREQWEPIVPDIPDSNPSGAVIGGGPTTGPEVMGGGTAFYVDQALLVTAAHVLTWTDTETEQTYYCSGMMDKNGNPLHFISMDESIDLAMLRTDVPSSFYFEIESDAPFVGASARALGFPRLFELGLDLSVTDGTISKLSGAEDNPMHYLISTPIQGGNSGGPVISSRGAVFGVVSMEFDCRTQERQCPNLGAIVHSRILMDFMQESQHGYFETANYFDPSYGIPPAVADAVIPVFCLR